MRIFSCITTLCGAAVLWACGGDPTADNQDDAALVATALEEDFGGLTADDEEPLFAEEETFAALEVDGEDPAVEESGSEAEAAAALIEEDVAAARDESRPALQRPVVYGVRLAWGSPHELQDSRPPRRWDPEIETECGVVAVRHLVRMELDDGVEARETRNAVRLRSATAGGVDGAVVVIAVRERACVAGGGRLIVRSSALEADIELPLDDSAADLIARRELADGERFIVRAHRVEPSGDAECVKGHMAGRWVNVLDRDGEHRDGVGRFYGQVTNELGDLVGHVRGIYGVAPRGRHAGAQVFFGKFINREGQFLGLMAGRYGEGLFGGGWHTARSVDSLRGFVAGEYTALEEEPEAGLFQARYASSSCERPLRDGEALTRPLDDGQDAR